VGSVLRVRWAKATSEATASPTAAATNTKVHPDEDALSATGTSDLRQNQQFDHHDGHAQGDNLPSHCQVMASGVAPVGGQRSFIRCALDALGGQRGLPLAAQSGLSVKRAYISRIVAGYS
jgi:hypothetical protein